MVTRAAACGTSTSGFLIPSTNSAMDGLSFLRMSSGLSSLQLVMARKRPGKGPPPPTAEKCGEHSASSAAGQSAATAWKRSKLTLSLMQIRWSGRPFLN
eukprot:3850144-Prymnesium_polylepis.1